MKLYKKHSILYHTHNEAYMQNQVIYKGIQNFVQNHYFHEHFLLM